MDKKKVKILDAKQSNEYVCVWLKLDGKDTQIVCKDEFLLDMIGKEVYISKEKDKDYKFELISK